MKHIDPELIQRYHDGNCTQEEKALVEKWLREEVNFFSGDDTFSFEDEHTANEIWQRIDRQLPASAKRTKVASLHKVSAILVAASLVALAFLGIYLLNGQSGDPIPPAVAETQTITVPEGKIYDFRLADSTVLYALGGTTVQFPKEFIGDTRELTLQEGEIYLQVTHLPDRPFIVHTSGTKVKVLGTRFNIRNRKRDSVITVALTEGSIRFISGSHGSEIMKPGDVLSYNKIENRVAGISHSGDADKEAAWARGVLYFDGTPLCEVLERLSDYYGVQFIPAHGIDTRIPFTATIDNMPLQSVLSLMAFATHLQFSHSEKTIFINNQK